MLRYRNFLAPMFPRFSCRPPSNRDTTSHLLPSEILIEEEINPDFSLKRFHPTCVGQYIQKYQIISKLGWGTGSTVWLAKDTNRWPWQGNRYVALKITNCFEGDQRSAIDELTISQRISKIRPKRAGRSHVRLIQESFRVPGPFGEHPVLVFEPLREPLWRVGQHLGSLGLPSPVIKPFLKLILQGLDFLHTECQIVHTDPKSENFLLGFEDDSVIDDYVREQQDNLFPFKEVDGHPIYQSQADFGCLRSGTNILKICDFGAAVSGTKLHYHDIQPEQFCGPEVLLKAGWAYSTYIWNLGMVLWELLEDTSLLTGLGSGSAEYCHKTHFAQMISLLGPPPQALLNRADKAVYCDLYNTQGEFKHVQIIPSQEITFSNRTTFFEGAEKRLFIEFASRMLRWLPEERSTAKELYSDPWLSYKP